MITSLKLKNFRNFSSKEVFFDKENNLIVGENGSGKTNILEAISILSGKNILSIDFENLVKDGEDTFYIEGVFHSGHTISVSYDKTTTKKQIMMNGKTTSLQKMKTLCDAVVVFQPIDMNMMYLSPSLRRNFLEEVLSSALPGYDKLVKNYRNILRNRNSFLKSIHEGKVKKDEIKFWDESFVNSAAVLYEKLFFLSEYIEKRIKKETLPYFFGKVQDISFAYLTKVDIDDIKGSIKKYLDENIDRDIIIGSTHIGPHVDDFQILVGDKNLENFASRGETKSVIIGLKMIETDFIRELTQKKPIILIDDLLSEIDARHREKLISALDDYQSVITSIEKLDFENIIYL